MTTQTKIEKSTWRFAMVAAPVLIATAQFYWQNGLLTATAGWLQVLAFTFWLVAFQGMFNALKDVSPTYSSLGFFIAAFACIGGAGFGFDGIFTHHLGYTSQTEVNQLHTEIGTPLIISLFLPGALFPLSIIVLGIQLIRNKCVNTWLGVLLIIAGIGFPLSRIPRIDWIAHADNALLIVSHLLIAIKGLQCKQD